MKGSTHYPMTARIASNIEAHGTAWTAQWMRKQGFELWEALVMMRGAKRSGQ